MPILLYLLEDLRTGMWKDRSLYRPGSLRQWPGK